MSPRVFKQMGSRVYRGRFRLGDNPKVFDVPLHTEIKEVAEAKLRQLVREKEEELAGIAQPKPLVEAALKPLLVHLADYAADAAARNCSRKHVALIRNRIGRLCGQCGWVRLGDVSSDSFNGWRSRQSLSPKTVNDYLGLVSAFFSWLERNGRVSHNPLRVVAKSDTRGKERRVRRALSAAEADRLVAGSGKRGLAYLLALWTGLRRGEIQHLAWQDLHLEAPKPYVEVRASTTKNKQTALLPLIPALVAGLRNHRQRERRTEGRVFRTGVPTARSLAADLVACGITVIDSLGRRVDFHALRHTFATRLNEAGVPPRIVMELMRHSDMRLTHKTYTNTTCFSLFSELEKLRVPSPSLLASLNSGFSCPSEAKIVQSDREPTRAEIIAISEQSTHLGVPVPPWGNIAAGGEGGIRTEFSGTTEKLR